jgi:hypothetical protein
LWALAAGGNNDPVGTAVELDKNGNVYICGQVPIYAPDIVVFGNQTLTPNYGNVNDHSAFIASFDPQGNELCATVTRVGGEYSVFLAGDKSSNAMYFSGYAFTDAVFGPDTLQGVQIPVYVFTAKWNCEPASVNEISSAPSLPVTVYPNPTNGLTTISFEINQPDQIKISVLDMQGKTVFILPEERYSNGKHNVELDLGKIPAGVYTIKLDGHSGISRQLIVKTQE